MNNVLFLIGEMHFNNNRKTFQIILLNSGLSGRPPILPR